MLFKNHICPKCSTSFDATSKFCPQCGESNKDLKEHSIGSGYLSIHWGYQLGCFFIGTVILFILSFCALAITMSFTDEENAKMISNFIIYGAAFCFLIPIIVLNAKKIFPKFAKLKPYLIGIGIGAAVIIFSILNTELIKLLKLGESTNQNELSSRAIIDTYPILSILIMGIIGPICEEFTYRVGLFSIVGRINRILAYIISSLVFALMHMDFSASSNIIIELLNLPSYIFAGVAFAFAYDKFSLPCSVTAHTVNNLFAVIVQIIVSNIK